MSEKLAAIAGIVVLLIAVVFWAFPFPVQAQAKNGISGPEPGEVLTGIVVLQGTATDPDFLRYELAFQREFGIGADWIVFAQGDRPVIDGTLAIWDTTVGGNISPVFPDGRYRLRLRVVRTDYNYDEYIVSGLVISNQSLTPSATPTLTVTIPIATAIPLPGTIAAATLQAGAGVLPTLTPFPTPSPPATPVDAALGPENATADSEQEAGRGLFGQLASIDTGRFGRAFWFGISVVAYAFVGLAVYLLLRSALRWLRRMVRAKWKN